jgi:tRNA threonylcarbamoyladenosine biosynthesis protein TsaE
MIATITARCAAETQSVAAALGRMLQAGDLVVLSGDLGAGKTTFVQGLARALGVDGPVTSPTFTIVQEYDATIPIAHVDVYRLHRIQELHDLGFEEMLEDRIVLIEWGEMVAPLLPRDRVDVHLEMDDDPDTRLITIDAHGPHWADRELVLDPT